MGIKRNITVALAVAMIYAAAMVSCSKGGNSFTTTVSFSKEVVPIFTNYCLTGSNCHASGNSVNRNVVLDSANAYNTLIAKGLISVSNPASSLLYVEVAGGEMPKPPAAALSTAQQTLILNWIKQGAQNN